MMSHLKTTASVLGIAFTLASIPGFSMDTKPIETPSQGHVPTSIETEAWDEFADNLFLEETYNVNPLEIHVSDFNPLTHVIAIAKDQAENPLVKTMFGSAVTESSKFIANQCSEIIPGISTANKLANFYKSTPADLPKGEGTLSRVVGQQIKSGIEQLPGGNQIISVASYLKPDGAETLAEGLSNTFLGPVGRTQITGAPTEIAGSFAKQCVNGIPFVGPSITFATGFLGRSIFGTETLTQGVLDSMANLVIGTQNADESSATDDESSESSHSDEDSAEYLSQDEGENA